MRTRSKLLLTALTAALVMAATVGTASARNLSISEQRFRAVWTPLEFTAIGGLIRVRCNVTLTGSFHYRSIVKSRGALIGFVTSAALTRPCTGGEAWILNGSERATNTLPWHVQYDSFRGTLPRLEGVRLALVGASFLLIASSQCLFASTAASPAFGIININAEGRATSLTADNSSQIPLRETLSGICPASGSFAGTTSSLTDGEGGVPTVRLI
jgi:hypothetical protein